MLLPLLARLLAPRAGAVCGAPLADGPRRAAARMRSTADPDPMFLGRAGWSETLDCFRAYQADTNLSSVPTDFVVPSRPPYPARSWGDALGRRSGRLVQQARRGRINQQRRERMQPKLLDILQT